jgi:hypothetical protein
MDAIERAERNPEELWTPGSIAVVKTALNALWLLIFSCLTVIAGAIVFHRRLDLTLCANNAKEPIRLF